jgi:hypothetical protein
MRSLGLKSEGAQRSTRFKEPGTPGPGLLAWSRLVTYQPPRLESQLLWGSRGGWT